MLLTTNSTEANRQRGSFGQQLDVGTAGSARPVSYELRRDQAVLTSPVFTVPWPSDPASHGSAPS